MSDGGYPYFSFGGGRGNPFLHATIFCKKVIHVYKVFASLDYEKVMSIIIFTADQNCQKVNYNDR